ncbi:MAG TPA: alpha/beta fold hydrolase [Bacteroidetes bacterium]|nr:alpha/beta fold hydrolase [Bacteroidota bacterium]
MKTKHRFRYASVFAVLLVVSAAFFSCEKEEDPFAGNAHLRSAEKLFSRTADYFSNLINTATIMYPEIHVLQDYVNDGADIYRIGYRTNFMGESITASGLLCIPATPGHYPILSFQNGTNTLLENAPSTNPGYELYQLLQSVASMGYVVVIADYIGFGASKQIFHPYLHKESTVQCLVDMLRAVNEFWEDIPTGITPLNSYYLTGYSQGGWSTLALLKALENEYKQEFQVTACACGAGPYDMHYFHDEVMSLEEYPSPGFLAYVSKAYIDHGIIDKKLNDLFQPSYATTIPQLFDGYHSIDEIHAALTTHLGDLFIPAYREGYLTDPDYADIRSALEENSVPAWHTEIPLLLVHGGEDDYVPTMLTHRLYDQMIQEGTSPSTCSKIILEGKNHGEGIVPASLQGLLFFQEH